MMEPLQKCPPGGTIYLDSNYTGKGVKGVSPFLLATAVMNERSVSTKFTPRLLPSDVHYTHNS